MVLRFPRKIPRWYPALAGFSLLVFLLPMPWMRVPTLNPFFLDRKLVLSGEADKFWIGVKTQLKPTDQIVAVMNWSYWQAHNGDIPYTLLCTANYPAYFQVLSASGYSPTAPVNRLPLKTDHGFWFGAFRDDQVSNILAERPDLKVIRLVSTHPLRITLSSGSGPPVDLTPYMQAAGIKESDPVASGAH
jgi:hypothetical protein